MGPKSEYVSTILLDDCHACIDSIRDSCTIKLPSEHKAYEQLLSLFSPVLEEQGVGTYADIKLGKLEALLPVPYWEWERKHAEVAQILSKASGDNELKYTWPLLKNLISECQCLVSGASIEISPYLPPLASFGSYFKANHRIFMSATVTDDSFLVKGLRLSPDTIRNPLTYKKERWSGEKMILIPSLINESMDREQVSDLLAAKIPNRKAGVVILCPSFKTAEYWEEKGCKIAKTDKIESQIDYLKSGFCDTPLVIANRYDGIDLPDDVCRILILDGKPYSDSLIERYSEECRTMSRVTSARIARAIEQGLGRSVRGEKDYSVIIIIGGDLVSVIRSQKWRKYFSDQTKLQVEIGLEIADLAKQEIEEGGDPISSLRNLIQQCLRRDNAWKAFYAEKMNEMPHTITDGPTLVIFQRELDAEIAFHDQKPDEAVTIIQKLIDDQISDEADIGWYLQQMARYTAKISISESNRLQLEAHKKNHYLMKPEHGMAIVPLVMVSQKRVKNIISWVQEFESFEQIMIAIQDTTSRLEFGVKADKFELAFHELGQALGFVCQRPDKEWKAGPDNLWAMSDSEHLLVECKSEVDADRSEIVKAETGQMNNSCAWAKKHYPGIRRTNIMIIPTNVLSVAAGFNETIGIMSHKELKRLRTNVENFFREFASMDLQDLSEGKIQSLLDMFELSVESLKSDYIRSVRSPNSI